jgi:hypothetical protein
MSDFCLHLKNGLPTRIISGFFFIVFLIVGLSIGSSEIIVNPFVKKNLNIPLESNRPLVNSNQQNLLVIGVDQLSSSQSHLESIWLVMYFRGKTNLTFVPIYPGYSENALQIIENLTQSLTFQDNGQSIRRLFDELSKSIWWDDYLILDEQAMVALIEYIGGISVQGIQSNGESVLNSIPHVDKDIQGALAGQAALLESACQQVSIKSLPNNMNEFLVNLNSHSRSNIDLFRAIQEWLLDNKDSEIDLNCEFPTIGTLKR